MSNRDWTGESLKTIPVVADKVLILDSEDSDNNKLVELGNIPQLDISCKVTKSATQSIPDNTDTTLTWNQEEYDTDGMHDNVTDNSEIVINTAGKYEAKMQSEWASDNNGERVLSINLNGQPVARNRSVVDSRSHGVVSWMGELAVDDVLTVAVFQNRGNSLDFTEGIVIENTYFAVQKLA